MWCLKGKLKLKEQLCVSIVACCGPLSCPLSEWLVFLRDDTLGTAAAFTSWNTYTTFSCGSFRECFLLSSKAGWPRCLWMAVCQVMQPVSVQLQLSNQRERIRSKPPSHCASPCPSLFVFNLWFFNLSLSHLTLPVGGVRKWHNVN